MAKVPTSLPKWTTIEELEKTNIGPVWVINNTEIAGDPGNLLMSIPKVNGNGYDLVRVYKSFVPFDLTLQVPRTQLLASSEFRNAVARKHVRLLTPEYAKAIRNSEDGKEEATRISNLIAKAVASEQAAAVTDHDEDDTFNPEDLALVGKKQKVETAEKRAEVVKVKTNPKIVNLVAKAQNEDWSQTQVKNAIRNYGVENLAGVDYKYLAESFSTKAKVIAFLKEEHSKAKA